MSVATAVVDKWTDFERRADELCLGFPVSSGAAGLAGALSGIDSHLCFRDVLTRGGWYRLGGVVDRDGNHLADDLAAWGESELENVDGDLHALVDAFAGSGLRATRLLGKTHYLVASTGESAGDFVQVEIEELQEVVAHELFAVTAPASLEELIDPPREEVAKAAYQPLGAPYYRVRRITEVAAFLQRMAAQKPEPQSVHRFLDAWQSSSAGNATTFSNHWVLAVREYLDRYRQPVFQATPVAAINGIMPRFDGAFGAQGLALSAALQRFDRQAGYPMAWFFHMLTTKAVSHAVTRAVIEDVQAGFSYLPERDVVVIKNWLHRPYGF